MSVLIKGMKMPSSCHECVAGFGMSCFVCPPEEDGECPDKGRPSWCPLIELPPHGRLIDSDELPHYVPDVGYLSMEQKIFNEVIANAPTIIEAEGEDGST